MTITITLDQWTATGDPSAVRQSLLNQMLAILPEDTTDAERLAAAQDVANRIIEAEVSALRRPFVPPIAAQDIVYVYKGNEAAAFLVDQDPDPARYPHLYKEAAGLVAAGLLNEDGTTPTAATVAAAIVVNATLWPQLSAAIEAERIPVGRRIKAASTVTDVEAALAAVAWPVF